MNLRNIKSVLTLFKTVINSTIALTIGTGLFVGCDLPTSYNEVSLNNQDPSTVAAVNKPIISSIRISKTSISLRPSVVNLGQVTINPTVAGKVIVNFSGSCISSAGDRIVLAASNSVNWGVNNGNVSVEAYDSDVNQNSFSHTRVYSVTAGARTFYAVGQNYVETDGNGIASIYGILTVKFIPSVSPILVSTAGINRTGINLRGSPVTLGQITINPSTAGKAIVHFDGTCISSVGDRIVLAASNVRNWGVNDGNVAFEASNSDINRGAFSHTRVYSVAAGARTFYAIGQNYVETAGNGNASVYGNLTVEFIPTNSGDAISTFTGISTPNTYMRGSPVTLAMLTLNPVKTGKALVVFDGLCISTTGDRIVLAASNTPDWGVNDGSVGVEARNTDVNQNSFCHTRVYNVTAGPKTYYAIGENYVETAGTGSAYVYGSLSAIIYY